MKYKRTNFGFLFNSCELKFAESYENARLALEHFAIAIGFTCDSGSIHENIELRVKEAEKICL